MANLEDTYRELFDVRGRYVLAFGRRAESYGNILNQLETEQCMDEISRATVYIFLLNYHGTNGEMHTWINFTYLRLMSLPLLSLPSIAGGRHSLLSGNESGRCLRPSCSGRVTNAS